MEEKFEDTLVYLLFCLVTSILMGFFCAKTANARGRNPNLWFLLGASLGLLAMLFLFVLPPKPLTAPSIQEAPNKGRPPPSFIPAEDVGSAPPKPLWYYLDKEEKQCGPMSFHALREAWEAEEISTNTYLWNETMNDWQTLESLPETLEELQT